MQNNIQNIFLLGNDQLMFVSGGGTIKRIAQGVFEGVAKPLCFKSAHT